MSIGAYVFVNIKAGAGNKVLESIKKIPEVKQAHLVTGLYDIIAYVEAPDMKVLGTTLMVNMQNVAGIDRTITCVCVNN